MSDTAVTIIAIILGLILMFVLPLKISAEKKNEQTTEKVKAETTSFLNKIKIAGTITRESYDNFVYTLSATGETYDIEIIVERIDEDYEKKNAENGGVSIGGNVYLTYYNTQVMEKLDEGEDGEFPLYVGDLVKINVKNISKTDAEQLERGFFNIGNNDTPAITASVTGLVTNGASLKLGEDINLDEPIGIGTDGEPVDMSLWNFRIIGNYAIGLGPKEIDMYAQTVGYDGPIVDGKIVGSVPQFIKPEGEDEFLPVTELTCTFLNYKDLIYAPEIPTTVTDMTGAFYGCENLIQASSIPENVTNLYRTFNYCMSLEEVPTIPDGVTNMEQTFFQCSDLTTIPNLPSQLENMYGTFESCFSLVSVPEIPDSVTNMQGAFYNCSKLTQIQNLPSQLENMKRVFYRCESLVSVPEIPNGVTDMEMAFYNCNNLESVPELPNSVKNMNQTFQYCTSLTTIPNLPSQLENMYGIFESCFSLVNVPEIPNGITNISRAFYGCKKLISAPVIPESVSSCERTFCGCSSLTGDLVINTNNLNSYNKCLNSAATNDDCDLKLSGSASDTILNNVLSTKSSNSHISLK